MSDHFPDAVNMVHGCDSPKPDPIVEAVRAKLLLRSEFGLQKYGVGLDRRDLSRLNWLRHLQEELMDACGYLERLIRDEQRHQRDDPDVDDGK